MSKVSAYISLSVLIIYTLVGIPCARAATIEIASGNVWGGTDITESSLIINDGTLAGAIHVNSGYNLSIQNRGTITASFSLDSGATVSQIISQAADITTLSGVPDYNVIIQNTAETLNWSTIVGTTGNTRPFTLNNAEIRLNSLDTIDSDIELVGDVFVHVNTTPNNDVLLFSDVSGGGMIHIVIDDLNPLYLTETNRAGGSVFVHVVRSGDYGNILGNNAGRFLNSLRNNSPNDKLITKADSAKTIGELKHTMSKSVKMHPIKLMQSVRTFYSHKMLGNMHIDDDFVFGVMPISLFSDGMFLIGAEPSANIKILDNLNLKMSGHILGFKFSDDINEYRGVSYGGGVDAVYKLPLNNFVRAYGDFSFSSFDSGLVFDGKRATNNPSGFSGYVAGEFGHKFNFDDEYYISPFVMLGADFATILNSHDIGAFVGVGADAGFGFELDGLRYDYVARGIVRSDGGVGLGLKFSVWSDADSVGADLGAGLFNDDIIGISYNISLNAKVGF